MKFIIGRKLNMTQIWENNQVLGVTKVQAGPCFVVQIKNKEKDGYEAVVLGFGERKEKNIAKPQLGQMRAAGIKARYLREFRWKDKEENKPDLKVGDKILIKDFMAGDIVKITSRSKGRGFQGVVKRHGFHGQDKTHGDKDQHRMPGSIGATGPAHVFKGMRMPGRMGNEQVSITNLKIVKVDENKGVLYINGSIPGARNSLVLIQGQGEFKNIEPRIRKSVEKKEDGAVKIDNKDKKKPQGQEKREENIEKMVIEAKEKKDKKK